MNKLILKTAKELPKLSIFEQNLKYLCGIVVPLGFFSVNANNVSILLRNGKYDGYREPGFRWTPIGVEAKKIYLGDINDSQGEMYVTEARGNPIIAKTSVTYRIINPLAYAINVQDDNVVPKYFESQIRHALSKFTYDELSQDSSNLFENFKEQTNNLPKMEEYGLEIQAADLLDIKYSPEIAKSMLIRQQALATIDARKHMVDGVVDIIRDINSKIKLPPENMSQLATYLAISMITDKSPQMTYQI